MKKHMSYFIVGILVLSGLGAVAIDNNQTGYTEMSENYSMSFSSPIITNFDDEFISVDLGETNSFLMNAGQPVLPKIVKTFELDFGVNNVGVQVIPNNIQEYEVTKEIRPGPTPLPLTTLENSVNIQTKDKEVYESDSAYPTSWFSYNVRCGLNADMERVTHVSIHIFPVQYLPGQGKLNVAESVDITVSYNEPVINPLSGNGEYDLVIIAPPKFEDDLQRLVDHKNSKGVNTIVKITDDIYDEYSGVDEPEQIKYFIKDAIETWDIKYVLLMGGLKSLIWGNPREHTNYGAKDWYVPVRYNNLYDNPKFPLPDNDTIHDPGVISDLYYADVYREGGVFEDWDPNDDGIFFAWDKEGYENDTGIDLLPDVAVGRLACRNSRELKIVIDKIIEHENNAYGKDWFKKIMVGSGDGFLDQEDLNLPWDTKGLPDGQYTIYAQSYNPDNDEGPVDEIHITLDKELPTILTFNHDDHLKFDTYPFDPIAEIVSVSTGDVLGNTDYTYCPTEQEAYCNMFTGWANLSYVDEVLTIRGKSYDPRPYGYTTDIHIWIEDSSESIVFDEWRYDTRMYYEGEWVTGEQELLGVGGGLYYMPEDFEKEILWTSNGLWTEEKDIVKSFNKGMGFIYLNGHGSPSTWGNHIAGIPGNRQNSHITGLSTWELTIPFLPMDTLLNFKKTPVVLVGGCHNSQFNVSLLATLLRLPSMWTYGMPAPETWSWWLARVGKRGAIATIGNTGLGYGVIGVDCNAVGLDGGICIEFLKQYGVEGYDILGETYCQTQINYGTNFDLSLQEHGKTITQWILLGDPSLKMGGYQPPENNFEVTINGNNKPGENIFFETLTQGGNKPDTVEWSFDKNEDGIYDSFQIGESVTEQWEQPGVFWVNVKATYGDEVVTYDTIVEITKDLNKPSRPSGKTTIKAGRSYTYTTSYDDPYEDGDLCFLYDWGDGTLGYSWPHSSGETARATHSWEETGTYEVKVLVIDTFGRISDWSDSLVINVEKSKQVNNYQLLQLLQNFFNNHPNVFPIIRQLLGL